LLKVKSRTRCCAGPIIAHANPSDVRRRIVRPGGHPEVAGSRPSRPYSTLSQEPGPENPRVQAGNKHPQTPQGNGEHKMRFSLRILGAGGVLCFLAFSAMGAKRSPLMSFSQLQITTPALPSGVASQSYRAMLAVIGGTKPYRWRLAAGSLPPGLTFNNSGAIGGAPCGDSGTWWATFQVTDARGRTARRSLSIFVGVAPLQITTPSLSDGIVGVRYSASLEATAGVPRCP